MDEAKVMANGLDSASAKGGKSGAPGSPPESLDHMETKVYVKRYLMLILFCLYSMSNAFQWIQYAIITSTISDYYGVGHLAINWTSVIYMVTYIPGILPASWLLNKKGLRFCVLLGSLGTCLGSWIKCASVSPDRFWVTMIGQFIVALAQLFILNIPPRLAAVWFGPKEVSRATAYGVFGNQFGISLGFVLPPIIVGSYEGMALSKKTPLIGDGLMKMFVGVGILTSIIFVLILVLFEDKPKQPPSDAQAQADLLQGEQTYMNTVHSLLTNRNYILLLVTYGINVGVFYAVSTVLNQMVVLRFTASAERDAGVMGLLITTAGMFGSVFCGFVLDKTHKYKETTLGVYIFSLLGMLAFMGGLRHTVIWPLFFVSAALGFFMTGYLPIGFEFAAEISYPHPEGTTAGLLNGAAQIFGIAFTFGSSYVVDNYGDLTANSLLSIALVAGVVLTALIKPDLKRQRAANRNTQTNGKLMTGDPA